MRLWQLLNEDWENLAQLNLGAMMDILKQGFGYGNDSGIGKKINAGFVWKGITSTSEIVDLGVIKSGLKDIRAAFRKYESPDACAFTIYISGNPVMVVITDQYHLAGASREAKMAYDLSNYKVVIDEIEQEVANWQRFTNKNNIKTEEEKEIHGYFDGEYKKQLVRTVGINTTTETVSYIMAMVMSIAKHLKQPVTAKIVLRDHTARDKRQARSLTRTQIAQGTKELKERLLAYKISKQPTANTIKEFIEWCNRSGTNVVTFAGVAYKMTPTESWGGNKISPLQVMQGVPFEIKYDSVDRGYSRYMTITYRYVSNGESGGGMVPIYARWTNEEGSKVFSQEAALDAYWYFNNRFKKTDVVTAIAAIGKDPNLVDDDKTVEPLMRHALGLIKDKKYSEALTFIEALQSIDINFSDLDAAYSIAKSKHAEQYGIDS